MDEENFEIYGVQNTGKMNLEAKKLKVDISTHARPLAKLFPRFLLSPGQNLLPFGRKGGGERKLWLRWNIYQKLPV